jgi:hypothetical protein
VSDNDESKRAAALDAALAELQQWGVDRFSIEGVAHRSQLDPGFLQRTWSGERQLILEALLSYSERMMALPDTGSLHGDLTELALSIASYVNEPVGRRIARMMVVDPKSQAADFDTRIKFWSMRQEAIEVIFSRASERGELRDDVKPTIVLQLLTSPLHTFALYTDRPVPAGYCRAIADMIARGVSR